MPTNEVIVFLIHATTCAELIVPTQSLSRKECEQESGIRINNSALEIFEIIIQFPSARMPVVGVMLSVNN